MNPIHESGAAITLLLLFIGGPSMLVLLLVAALSTWFAKERRGIARAAIVLTALASCVLLVFAAFATGALHGRIDADVAAGGYGPALDPTLVRSWHDSARWTARIGLLVGGVPLMIAAGLWRRAREKVQHRIGEWIGAALAAMCLLWCLARALF
ncbi:MAG: hypothetical protein R3B13_38150 [Polyangiaceae bacterium]